MAEREVKIRFEAITDPTIKEIGKLKREVISLGAALLGLKGFSETVKAVGAFNDGLMRTKFSANLTSRELIAFKDSMYQASMQTGASTDALSKMGKEALKVTKDIGFVSKSMKLMGDISNVIGTSEGVGEFIAQVHDATGLAGKELDKYVMKLVSLSQQKGMEIDPATFFPKAGELIEQFKKIMPNASKEQIGEMVSGAMFTENSTGFMKAQRRIFQMMGNDRESQKILKLGFKKGSMPGVMDVVAAIQKMNPGDRAKQMTMLSAALKGSGINLAKLISESDKYAEAKKKANPADVARQAEEAAKSYAASMEKMKTAGLLISDIVLSQPIKDFGAWLGRLTKSGDLEKFKIWVQEMIPVALALGGAIAAWKLFQFGKNAITTVGSGGRGIGALGSMTNPMYVIVVAGAGKPGGVPGGVPGKGLGAIAAVALPVAIGAAIGIGLGAGVRKLQDMHYEGDFLNKKAVIEPGLSRPWENVGGAMSPSSILKNRQNSNGNQYTAAPIFNVDVSVDGTKLKTKAVSVRKTGSNVKIPTVGNSAQGEEW